MGDLFYEFRKITSFKSTIFNLGNNTPINNREWDGYVSSDLTSQVEFQARMNADPTLQGPYRPANLVLRNHLENKVQDFVTTQTITQTLQRMYVPSWQDYVFSPEKIANDNLETQIAFASICQTDTIQTYKFKKQYSDKMINKKYK